MRAYWRQRQMQVRYAASHVQHMQKAMEQINVKLAEVVTDITGLTGMSIIEAILGGERDPVKLANLRDGAVIPARITLPLRCKEPGGPTISWTCGRRTSCPVPSSAHHRVRNQVPAELAGLPNRREKLDPQAASVGVKAMTSGSTRPARCSSHWAWTYIDRWDRRGNGPGGFR